MPIYRRPVARTMRNSRMFSSACQVPKERPILSEMAKFMAVKPSVPKPQGTSQEMEKPIKNTPTITPTILPINRLPMGMPLNPG